MDFLLQRAKAFVAVLMAGLVPVAIGAFESAVGVSIPPDWKITITAFVTGLVVHTVPNAKPK